MNPYVVIAVMVVIDIITLPFIIRKILKKDIKHKAVKVTAMILVFVVVEAVCSFMYIDSHTFYDRLGNQYQTQEGVRYYDREENEYVITEDNMGREYFTSLSGKYTRIAELTYIDSDGYLYFDLTRELTKDDSKYAYTDEAGNKYYRPEEVEWNRNGEIRPVD